MPACSIFRVALVNTCRHVALPVCLSDEHLCLLHCDMLELIGCKPCMDKTWLEGLVVSTEATQFARRYEGMYVLADKSARVQVPAAEPSKQLGQAVYAGLGTLRHELPRDAKLCGRMCGRVTVSR